MDSDYKGFYINPCDYKTDYGKSSGGCGLTRGWRKVLLLQPPVKKLNAITDIDYRSRISTTTFAICGLQSVHVFSG